MKKIPLDTELLRVESFSIVNADAVLFGTLKGREALYTNASDRPCSRCCPQTLVEGEAA